MATPWLQIPGDNADGAGMLAHLHGLFVGADLLYDDEFRALGMSPLFAFVTGEGVVSNHWSVGATWLQAPGFLLGRAAGATSHLKPHAATWTMGLLGVRVVACIAVGGALVEIYRRSEEQLEARGAAVLVAVLLVGTPLLYYAAEAPQRPHAFGFVVVTAFVLCFSRARGAGAAGPAYARALLLGALAGLAACIRPQLAPLLALAWLDAGGARRRRREDALREVAASTLAFLPWALVNLNLQFWLYGPGLFDYFGGDSGASVSHHLIAFLFSAHHGVLAWGPIFVVGFVVLGISVRRGERGAWLIALILIHQLWLNAGTREIEVYEVLGTRTWAGGTSFAPRKLLDVAPLFLPAVWSVGARAGPRERWILAAVAIGSALPTALLHLSVFLVPAGASGLLDGPAFRELLVVPLHPDAWASALSQRRAPIGISLRLFAIASVPLAGLWLGLKLGWARISSENRTRAALAAVLGLGVLAQIWIGVLQLRSDAMLASDPARMEEARREFNPPHVRAVETIPSSQHRMREVVGDHAVPPLIGR